MKSKAVLTRKDVAVTLGCVIFLLATVGAVGESGRRRAKEAVCASNLRRLGTAFEQFTSDNDGYFHEGFWGMPDCVTPNWWFEALKPYYENQNLCLCPMAVKFGSEIGRGEIGATFYAWSAQGWLPEGYYGSYGINGWVENNQCPSESENTSRRRWRTPNVAGGSNIPLLLGAQWIDGWPHDHHDPPAYDDQDFRTDPSTSFDRFCLNRHEGCINGVFLDGSVRKVGLKELWTLKWNREYNTCGSYTQCGGMQPSSWPDWMRDFQDY